MDIKEIVNDPEWQTIRGAFVGTWKKTPVENIAVLRAYLYGTSPVEYLRWRRVYNYLTGSAFRMGVITHPAITELLTEVRALKPVMSA